MELLFFLEKNAYSKSSQNTDFFSTLGGNYIFINFSDIYLNAKVFFCVLKKYNAKLEGIVMFL